MLNVTSEAAVNIKGSEGLQFGALAISCGSSATDIDKLRVQYMNAGGDDEENKAISILSTQGEIRTTGNACEFDPAAEGGDSRLYVHAMRSNIGCSNKVTCMYDSTPY